MKQYLVTDDELRRRLKIGDVIDLKELPPGSKVLTREQVAKAIREADSKWLADPATTIDRALDELFGEEVGE